MRANKRRRGARGEAGRGKSSTVVGWARLSEGAFRWREGRGGRDEEAQRPGVDAVRDGTRGSRRPAAGRSLAHSAHRRFRASVLCRRALSGRSRRRAMGMGSRTPASSGRRASLKPVGEQGRRGRWLREGGSASGARRAGQRVGRAGVRRSEVQLELLAGGRLLLDADGKATSASTLPCVARRREEGSKRDARLGSKRT